MKEVINNSHCNELRNLYFISKWGCDGSSGMSEYKQRITDPNISYANIFLTSFVPVQLVSGDPSWQNPRPSSPRFCRPIRIQFVHETTDITVKEVDYVESQISSLSETVINLLNGNVSIKHKMLLTMIDGKVCNAVTKNSSTQRWFLCGLTAKDFNKMDVVVSKKVQD